MEMERRPRVAQYMYVHSTNQALLSHFRLVLCTVSRRESSYQNYDNH